MNIFYFPYSDFTETQIFLGGHWVATVVATGRPLGGHWVATDLQSILVQRGLDLPTKPITPQHTHPGNALSSRGRCRKKRGRYWSGQFDSAKCLLAAAASKHVMRTMSATAEKNRTRTSQRFALNPTSDTDDGRNV